MSHIVIVVEKYINPSFSHNNEEEICGSQYIFYYIMSPFCNAFVTIGDHETFRVAVWLGLPQVLKFHVHRTVSCLTVRLILLRFRLV